MMEPSLERNQTLNIGTYEYHPLHLTLYLVFTIPLWLLDVIGNVLVLLCVYREKQLRRPSYYLVAALSLADVAFPVFGYVPTTYNIFNKDPWVCDPVIQFYLLIPSNTAAFASFLILITLTSERYLSIAFPVYHRKTVTTRRVFAVVAFNSILSAFTCITLYPMKPSSSQRLYCAPFQLVYLATAVPFGFIGLILLFFLNAHLLILIKRRLRKEAERNASENSDVQIRRRDMNAKASKAVSTVVIFFVICWLPVTLFLLMEAVNYTIYVNVTLLEVGRKSFSAVFLINGAINPIVYARQSPQFRSAFRKLLGRQSNQVLDVTEVQTMNTVSDKV